MQIDDIIKSRHSVRKYIDRAIPIDIVLALQEEIANCNKEGNLNMQLVLDDEKAFSGVKAHYGALKGVTNYIVMAGKKGIDLSERLGYYGEKVVLKAQALGLNTCWVGLSLSYNDNKKAYKLNKGEIKKLIITIGYGATGGHERKSKSIDEVTELKGAMPEWFRRGVEYALYAPTAMNQQKFKFVLSSDNKVKLRYGLAFYGNVDKGIVKYHFELCAGKENFSWEE